MNRTTLFGRNSYSKNPKLGEDKSGREKMLPLFCSALNSSAHQVEFVIEELKDSLNDYRLNSFIKRSDANKVEIVNYFIKSISDSSTIKKNNLTYDLVSKVVPKLEELRNTYVKTQTITSVKQKNERKEKEEPGYRKSLLNGYSVLHNKLLSGEKLTIEFIDDLHANMVAHFTNDQLKHKAALPGGAPYNFVGLSIEDDIGNGNAEKTFVESLIKRIIFEKDDSIQLRVVTDEYNKDYEVITSSKILRFKNQQRISPIPISDNKDAIYNDMINLLKPGYLKTGSDRMQVIFVSSAESRAKKAQQIIAKYYNKKAETHKIEERIDNIADTLQRLFYLHQYLDGNGRTLSALMQFMLLENGLECSDTSSGKNFAGYMIEKMRQNILEGQLKFKNEFGSITAYKLFLFDEIYKQKPLITQALDIIKNYSLEEAFAMHLAETIFAERICKALTNISSKLKDNKKPGFSEFNQSIRKSFTTLLLNKAKLGSLDQLENDILAIINSINKQDRENYNLALRQSCKEADYVQITQLLIDNYNLLDLDINAQGSASKKTALHVAADNKNLIAINFIIDKLKANIIFDAKDTTGKSVKEQLNLLGVEV